MTNATRTSQAVQVYQVFIKATPGAIWDAITKPEWAERYGYRSRVEYELRQGGAYRAFGPGPVSAAGAAGARALRRSRRRPRSAPPS